jgi:cytochrome c peroxidase
MNARYVEAVGCGILLLAACGSANDGSESPVATSESLQSSAPVLGPDSPVASAGRLLFDKPFPHTNGRACATCHVASNHFALLPSDAQARFSANHSDPLFNPIDADDPTAATPTYEHVKLGLIRITLKLPDNMDLINADGSQVVTPPDRTFSVWRGVPTVENTFYTAPYQYDGRFPTLQIQAQGAITAHSQGSQEPQAPLDLIAGFEDTVYSSDRARSVALQVALAIPTDKLKNPEDSDTSNGNVVYVKACKGCHGGAKDNTIVNRAVVNNGFNLFSTYERTKTGTLVTGGAGPVVLKSDGTVLFQSVPDPSDSTKTVIVSTADPQPNDEFLNLGFAGLSAFGQQGINVPIGPDPNHPHLLFNASVPLPHYRYRFYTDGSRTTQVTDLPPIPQPGFPLATTLDANGLPICGPNFFQQTFSTDPGRAGITGNPEDFEAFDIPQLRGIANTAPYFHDNSHATLADVIDTYSRFILPPIAALGLPAVNPPEAQGLPPEALSPKDKADLLAFLRTF